METRVSIIIPIFNVSGYLVDCLESCISQTYKNLEFICIDDGSTDDSGSIVEHYGEIDGRFKIIHKPNGGLPSARKAGIEIASGEYIFHLDGDDSIPADAIEQLVGIAIKDDADIVIGDYLKIDEDENKIYIDSRLNGVQTGEACLNSILAGGLFNIWGKLIRRSLYIKNQIHIPLRISIGEDLVQMIQLSCYSQRVSSCKTAIYNYYVRTTSMSKQDKNVTGSLTDRSIYAVQFITDFLKDKVPALTLNLLRGFVKRFIMQYMRSPYPVSIRRKELSDLVSFINEDKDMRAIRTFQDLICRIAANSLPLAKELVRMSKIYKQ